MSGTVASKQPNRSKKECCPRIVGNTEHRYTGNMSMRHDDAHQEDMIDPAEQRANAIAPLKS
jgi:hypothetical protein